jgi:hypothetical protein
MNLAEVQNKRSDILRIAAAHGASNIRVFGSVARGEARPDSDVDFLIDVDPGRSLLDLGGLLMDLQDLLGAPVQVVEPQALHWYVKERVLKEAVLV